ncbi:amidase signature domain-containing protein [Apiosordaria backusii]|uniref:Amidase signature domain-containing protein n=1 Tax=Apiosordaria backusii TaxID=314023 RepID=A0AA39ZPJ5_9PEZI|nr:amidase signature domain-containing protein [Apiosordaria backusii]
MAMDRVFEIGGDSFIGGAGIPLRLDGTPERLAVFRVNNSAEKVITKDWVDRILAEYGQDDVFGDMFLDGVIFVGDGAEIEVDPRAREVLKARGNTWIKTLGTDALKLYDDTHSAFLHAIRRGPNGKFRELKIAGSHSLRTLAVAVPSRVGIAPTPDLPLNGFRIAVKDIFEIENVRISVCNRAYYELYDPPQKTAACVQLLIAAGATIVGTTKLASFAATEEPVECIDYDAPWNPRADGYQSPAGSSSGSGAAMAAYEWLDITIGSDSNFDVPTFFGREIGKCRYFADSWYGKSLKPPQKTGVPAIIYPTDYMSVISNKTQLDVIDKFVEDLESSLGVPAEKVSFNDLWESTTPGAANGLSLQEFMKDASRNSFFYDDYHSFDKFRADYFEKFGKRPYISPPVRWQWDLSSKITAEERDEAVERLDVYRQWFTEHVLQEGKRDTIVLIPIENILPRYRDDPPLKHFNPVGVPMLFVSPILGAPELTVPIGHTPFLSKVTGNEEQLPIAISLFGSPGRDLELFDIATKCLQRSKRPIAVKPGNDIF